MFEITPLDYVCPPFHLNVYTSCEGPSIYGQLRSTNNHSLQVKNLLLLSAKFCSAFVYAHPAFWLPVYYSSISAEPMEIWPIPKGAKPFPALSCPWHHCVQPWNTVICVLSCSLGGKHHLEQRLNTRCTSFDRAIWTSWQQRDHMPDSWHHTLRPACLSLWWNTPIRCRFIFTDEISNLLNMICV